MRSRTCHHCDAQLSPFARADSRYCSTRCRVAAHRAEHGGATAVPADLRARDRWVRHRDKRPMTADGRVATSTDPSTWSTWDAVTASRMGDGLGFVLNGDGVVGIDLDHCIEGRRLKPWAEQLLAQMPKTYTEVSPSGTGLHVWGMGNVVKGRIVKLGGSGRLELYGRGRYLTVTGRRFRKAPARLADLSAFISSLA